MTSRLSTDFPQTRQYPSTSSQPLSYTKNTPETAYGAYRDVYHPSDSYYEAGEARDEEFDVRADFDGTGPRWSEMHGKGLSDSTSYRPVINPAVSSSYSVFKPNNTPRPGEEMVSVPVLGPEWQKSELHEMSRRGHNEVRSARRRGAWRAWTRDQRGTFGAQWLTKRVLVFIVFFFAVALGIVLFFVIPRAPSFSFNGTNPFSVDNSTISFSRTPTNFSFTGTLNMIADTSFSYLPTHFTSLQATLYDLNTAKAIATGDYGNHIVPRGSSQNVTIPVQFSYSTLNASDPTWLDIYNACAFIYPGTTRPDLSFRVVLRSSILGLVTHPETSTLISGVTFPFERPSNGV